MVPLLEHETGLFKGRLNCHGPGFVGRALEVAAILGRVVAPAPRLRRAELAGRPVSHACPVTV